MYRYVLKQKVISEYKDEVVEVFKDKLDGGFKLESDNKYSLIIDESREDKYFGLINEEC